MTVNLPKGTRDHLPQSMHGRNHVVRTIEGVFHRFGFEPLETPAFERIETLTGKYGGETDKLMFKIHKRGRDAQPGDCDLALRYDLTVPLARVLAMHPELRMPFKRYQIQPVWRAERPQRGRFREFYQCDIDIAGTNSMMADAECIAVAAEALSALGFTQYVIRINDRRILSNFARMAGANSVEDELSVLIAIDKLDKIGREKVDIEVSKRGFNPDGLQGLWDHMATSWPSDAEAIHALSSLLDDAGREGLEAVKQLLEYAAAMGVNPNNISFDPTLARGADYYTGPVFEAHLADRSVGSVAGGGRYDGLVSHLSGREVPAVGISLGMERLLVIMEDRKMLPDRPTAADVLITIFSPETAEPSANLAMSLRAAGISTELYLGEAKLKSQMKHAEKRGYPWVIVQGPDEIEAGTVMLRNTSTWNQTALSVDDAILAIKAGNTGDG